MPASNEHINILSWNAQSIANNTKTLELEMLLRDNNVHIACIQETYLKPDTKIYLDNYRIYRNDRLIHGGGVAIVIRRDIQHKLINMRDTKFIENISVAVNLNHRDIIITSAYSPRHTAHFVHDIGLLSYDGKETIILGDLNAKHSAWNCPANNAAGTELQNFLDSSAYVLLAPDAPTHYPHSGATPSTIDLLLTNATCPIVNVSSMSDHCPVLCQLAINVNKEIETSFRYDYADWEKFRESIEECTFLPTTDSGPAIDDSISKLSAIILDARDAAVPTASHRGRLNRIAPDTRNAIRYKNKLYR